jgi:predicted transcriptional regulator
MLEFATGETAGLAKGTADPSEEAADFIQAHGNYFPELEEAAESLRRDAGLAKTTSASRLVEHLSERFGLEVRLVPQPAATNPGDEGEGETLRLLLCEADPPRTRRFLIARHIALLAFGSLLETHLASQHFSSDPTAAHGRRVLSGYLAGALLMPYDDFLAVAQALRYDVERLQQRFAVSFEQVCHRLTTLQKPGAKGVPFHFLRVDIAGNISKRFSASGLRIPRYGGACPRWAVHAAFLTPARICRQVSIMPDGVTYLDIARTVVKGGYGYGKPKSCFAVGIGCATVHAADLVYSDGLNLNDTSAVVPVGVTCRLCERDDCQQRAFAPILPSLRGRVGKSPLS